MPKPVIRAIPVEPLDVKFNEECEKEINVDNWTEINQEWAYLILLINILYHILISNHLFNIMNTPRQSTFILLLSWNQMFIKRIQIWANN